MLGGVCAAIGPKILVRYAFLFSNDQLEYLTKPNVSIQSNAGHLIKIDYRFFFPALNWHLGFEWSSEKLQYFLFPLKFFVRCFFLNSHYHSYTKKNLTIIFKKKRNHFLSAYVLLFA